MNTYSKFLRNNIIIFSGQILSYLQGIIIIPIIIKTVGVHIYGGYILLISIVGFIYGISSFGVGFCRSRFLPSATGKESRQLLFFPQFYFQCVSLLIISIISVYFYPYFDKYFLKGDISFSIWLIVPYFAFYLLYSQASDYFRYTHRMGLFNFGVIAFLFINIAFILLAFTRGYKLTVNALFGLQIASSILVALPLSIKMFREIGFRFALESAGNFINDIKLGFPLVLIFIVETMLISSDRFIISAFLSVSDVGYYNPGYSLGSFIIFFAKVSGVVLPPLLSKAVDSGDEVEAHTMFNYTVKGFMLLAIPFIVGCVVMSKPILSLLANAEVAKKGHVVAPIVALGALFYGLNIILSNVLFVRMKTVVMFKMNLIAATLKIILNLVLLYIFRDILVAAFTTFICYFVVFILMLRAVLADWTVSFNPGTMVKSVVASLFMGLVLYSLSSMLGQSSQRLVSIFLEIGLGIIIYTLALLALKTFSRKELLYLRKAYS